jgi:hypothetical protein
LSIGFVFLFSFFVFFSFSLRKSQNKKKSKNEFRLKNHPKMTFTWFDQGWLKKKFFTSHLINCAHFFLKEETTAKAAGEKKNSSHGGLV